MEQLYKTEISEYLEELGKELDITQKEHEGIVESYQAVGNWLSKDDSSLTPYNPKILPQGSFMLGTIVKPINPADDIDIDLVCKLEKKPIAWTQRDLKIKVGERLKSNSTYDRMLWEHKDGENYDEGGRRCWTLKYADVSGYHMDILPSFSSESLTYLMEKTFSINSELSEHDLQALAIRITDTEKENYSTDNNIENWHKSNPFGYAQWFLQKALISKRKMFSLNESIDPVREYEKEKLPLQRVVQLLKRHRDIMFSSDEYECENRPISVIITTLATLAYDKSENLIDAYSGIVTRMRNFIENRFNPVTGQYEKWVANPINRVENFADKWTDVRQKEEYFYLWLDKLEEDLEKINNSKGKGLQYLNESLSKMYGKEVTNKVFVNNGRKKVDLRQQGQLKMAGVTGMLGEVGRKVQKHNFEGDFGE
ncbi:nucleotidyltransferase domain-containing protein [Chryseobacterium daeguense]|uniref:nucleotidyltransferase domain-containing protein n=1 Tax=Chryseobacterium daeguense TaxID=412438 RepID=UPI000422B2DC|nr:nucleotidyltransferase [Chryseobacterium daeguense]